MSLLIKYFVLAMGIACIILSGILFRKKHPFWILSLVILNAGLFCIYFGHLRYIDHIFGHFYYPYSSLLVSIGIYVFFKNLQTRRISKKDKILLGIVLIEPILITSLFILRSLDPNFTLKIWDLVQNFVNFFGPSEEKLGKEYIVVNLQMLFFFLFAISFVIVLFNLSKILKKAEQQHLSFFCTDSFSYYTWIRKFITFFTVTSIYAIGLVLSGLFVKLNPIMASTLYLTMGFCGLGLFGLGFFTPIRFAKEKDFKAFIEHIEKTNNPIVLEIPEEPKSTPVYKGTQIGDYKKILLDILEKDKAYQDPQLSLASLAELMNTSTRTSSRVISEGFDKNFFDLINSYRIEEVKKHLLSEEYAHYSILSIGLEAGFNSKSTFYGSFKKYTGMTPSQYKKQST